MKIDWASLLLVVGVTLAVTVIAVSFVAIAAKLLDAGHARQHAGQSPGALAVGAYALFGIVGLMVLFGLYLIIPYFR